MLKMLNWPDHLNDKKRVIYLFRVVILTII